MSTLLSKLNEIINLQRRWSFNCHLQYHLENSLMRYPNRNSQVCSARLKNSHLNRIDCFTNELVQSKLEKWSQLKKQVLKDANSAYMKLDSNLNIFTKAVTKDWDNLRYSILDVDVRYLSEDQLDNFLSSTILLENESEFIYLIKQCVQWRKLPSKKILISCMHYLNRLSQIEQIECLLNIYRSDYCTESPDVLTPLFLLILWRGGGSTETVLQKLTEFYKDNYGASTIVKRAIHSLFRTIAEESLSKKSQAVLMQLIKFAENIYSNFNDIYPLACIWKTCFTSQWFCDQKTATELFQTNQDLQQIVINRYESLCKTLFSENNIDAVYRLIQLYLQHGDCKDACSFCLRLLFTHQYKRLDRRACYEIVKTCNILNIPLNGIQKQQYLSLLCNQTPAIMPADNNIQIQMQPKKFQYKF